MNKEELDYLIRQQKVMGRCMFELLEKGETYLYIDRHDTNTQEKTDNLFRLFSKRLWIEVRPSTSLSRQVTVSGIYCYHITCKQFKKQKS
jgi:hypothetical protein